MGNIRQLTDGVKHNTVMEVQTALWRIWKWWLPGLWWTCGRYGNHTVDIINIASKTTMENFIHQLL